MLVSCVIPTYNRALFIPSAIKAFQSQDYPELELIIVSSGENISHLIPNDARIKHVHFDHQVLTGDGRNIGTELAAGQIIFNWDDDDWYGPTRIQKQVDFHLASGKGVSGQGFIVLHDLATDTFSRYDMRSPYSCGPSICYSKHYWEHVDKIDPINDMEDANYVMRAATRNEMASSYDDKPIVIVARTHPGNTVSRSPLDGLCTPEPRPTDYEYEPNNIAPTNI
jgi:glycosyltransferase involved in cell wall biosynthesis